MVEESPGVALAMWLRDAGCLVKVFDPAALDAARTLLGTKAAAASMEACAREADVLVLTTPWPIFASLSQRESSVTYRPKPVDGIFTSSEGVLRAS